MDTIANGMINVVRFALGKEITSNLMKAVNKKYLKKAIEEENKKNFPLAINNYETFLKLHPELPLTFKSAVLLHLGYCNTQLNNHDKALKQFQNVIQEVPEGDQDAKQRNHLHQYSNW